MFFSGGNGLPYSCVSKVQQVLFYHFSISLYIQYQCAFGAISAVFAKCNGLIGQICSFGSEKLEKLSLVRKNKCRKVVQQNFSQCERVTPKMIFNAQNIPTDYLKCTHVIIVTLDDLCLKRQT